MPRPTKSRKVCRLPAAAEFRPAGCKRSENAVILAVEEYEALRLIDKEGFSQEECSEYMGVARTTVQQIYTSARQKIAIALVDGLSLKIQGGSYRLCDGKEEFCGCGGCSKHRKIPSLKRSLNNMKIAVTYENGKIFQHFGHTQQFKIYEIENGKVLSAYVLDTEGSGHGALAGLLHEKGVDALICGGIGGGAQTALARGGIRLFGGVQGDADKAVEVFLAGALAYDPDVKCDHHEHEHGGHSHSCGSHGCGNHGCGNH